MIAGITAALVATTAAAQYDSQTRVETNNISTSISTVTSINTNTNADKGEHSSKTISTTKKHTSACCHPVSVAVSGTADYSVAQTDAIAAAVPARTVSTGCTNKAGYR